MAIIMHELNEEVFIYFARLGGNPDSSFLLYLDILIHTIGELEPAAQSDRLKKKYTKSNSSIYLCRAS